MEDKRVSQTEGPGSSMKIYIGTSGWSYPHWGNRFYPPDLPKAQWLPYLATVFDTVEINATFYRQPRSETFEKWFRQTPDRFLFSIKANRFITHIKRLKEVAEPLNRFYKGISPLGKKVGAILFQLPPSLRFDPDTVASFLEQIDPRYPVVIEPRNTSFFTEAFYKLLADARCALCWSDTAGRYPYREVVTAHFLYIRLHGSPVLYRSSYSRDFLNALGQKILDFGLETFIYFDNDADGHAPENALTLKKIVETRRKS